LIACRNRKKADEAVRRLNAKVKGARVQMVQLDLASPASVRACADQVCSGAEPLDLLINNAGIMAIPKRLATPMGFEMQFGVNHLGHFALTGLLLPALLKAKAPRVVSVSSIVHRTGTIDFDDLQSERGYAPWAAYSQSKLANLLFAFEFQRKIDSAGTGLMSVAAHPGYSATNLQSTGPNMNGPSLTAAILTFGNAVMAQSAAMGALPILYAATAPDAKPGGFYGPGGPMELWGYPVPALPAVQATSLEAAARLWDVSEQLTGVKFETGLRSSAPTLP